MNPSRRPRPSPLRGVRPQVRLREIGVPPVATAALFWVLQRLDLMADTPLWVLWGLLVVGLAASEVLRVAASEAYRARTLVMVAASGSVIYATGWGPVLAIGFMYAFATPVRSFGSRAAPTAMAGIVVAVLAGQVAVAAGLAPSLIEERLAHGLAVLGLLGLGFPSWVIASTAAKKEASEAELVHRATHDPLTRLPNRAFFLDRLRRALERHDGRASQTAVLFADLDRFKVVNDSLGHEVGDQLLQGVAERIRSSVRPGDTVARLGGDEFTVLLAGIGGVDDAVQVAERIGEELELPFVLAGYDVVVSASVGIAVSGSPEGGGGDLADADALLRDADVAMYQAKRRGGRRHEVFTRDMGERALRRLELEGRLRRAIDERDFELRYQPEVDLRTGEVVGAEALVRWIDRETGEVPLDDVIPIAEETGLILPLGRWVLEHATGEARSWFDGVPPARRGVVAVNISARQFQQPDLVSQVSAVLGAAALDPARLRLEITESAVMLDVPRGVALVHDLKSLGVQVALDDFGTGHSSLSSLSSLPADVVKLDQSFVARLADDPSAPPIVAAVIVMAHELGLSVVGEGVETAEQASVLAELGCDSIQGYLFSPAVPGDEAAALVRTGRFSLDRLAARRGDPLADHDPLDGGYLR